MDRHNFGGIGPNRLVPAAEKLKTELIAKLGDATGPVTRLSTSVVVEISEIDITASREVVLEAVQKNITGDDAASLVEKQQCVTGLWEVKSSRHA